MQGVPSEQSFVGITGAWPRKHAPISVPPEMLMIGQRASADDLGEPPVRLGVPGFARRAEDAQLGEIVRFVTGSSPAGISARTKRRRYAEDGDAVRSHIFHSRSGPG